MSSLKLQALVVVSALLLVTCLFATGCGQKEQKTGWVNTNSMPGHTFSGNPQARKKTNSKIIYLGSTNGAQRSGFGPQDPSFDFENLR